MVPDLQPTPLTKVQFCLRRSALARVLLMRRVGDAPLVTASGHSGSLLGLHVALAPGTRSCWACMAPSEAAGMQQSSGMPG